jgi:small subunit ribosomal protein S24e
MEIQIDEKRENPLLDRTDVRFTIVHAGEKTPQRDVVKNELAKALGAKAELTIIDRMRSVYGRGTTRGQAKVYSNLEKARHHERNYIQKRNKILVEKKEEES